MPSCGRTSRLSPGPPSSCFAWSQSACSRRVCAPSWGSHGARDASGRLRGRSSRRAGFCPCSRPWFAGSRTREPGSCALLRAGSPGPSPCDADVGCPPPRSGPLRRRRGSPSPSARRLAALTGHRRARRCAGPLRAPRAPTEPGRRSGRLGRASRTRVRPAVARASWPRHNPKPATVRCLVRLLRLANQLGQGLVGLVLARWRKRWMRQHSDLALGRGDNEVGSLLLVRALDLVDIVQDLVDAAERIAVHLVTAGRLLEVQRRDDLRVVGRVPTERAASSPDKGEGENEQGHETPVNTGHFACNLPAPAGGNSPRNERGAARRPPLSYSG